MTSVTPAVPSSSRTVPTGQTLPPTPTPYSGPLEPKRIQLSVPSEISAPFRPGTFPSTPSRQQTASSSSTNGGFARRGVNLDNVVERQANVNTTANNTAGMSAKALGKRKRTVEEEEAIHRADVVLRKNRELDISMLTENYIPAHPFESAKDIVDRLLPFHIWQIHDQDLDYVKKDTKRKTSERVATTKLVSRKIALMERLRKAQVRADDSESRPDKIQLLNSVVASIRDSHVHLQTELRDRRMDYGNFTNEIRRKEEEQRQRALGTSFYPGTPGVARPGVPGRPIGTPTMSRTGSGSGASAGTPGGSANTRPPTEGTQPIMVNVPIALHSELTRLKIINLQPGDNPVNNDSTTPARLLRTSDDMKFIILSVTPRALNPEQLNFLAGVLTRQQQLRNGAASPATAVSPVAPGTPTSAAGSPHTVTNS